MTDQAKSTSLVEYLAQGFDQQENCDVMFTVDGKTIGAHKSLLQIMKARCQGLSDMVTEWKSGDDPISVDIMDFNSFRCLLRYVYCDEIAISNENVFIYLSAAIQWKMPRLEELCADYLSKYLSTGNVCYYMNEAVNFQSTALQDKCREVFSEQTLYVGIHKSFLNLSLPAISAFLDTECTTEVEITLFHCIQRWMRHQCQDQHLPINGTNMRHVIGDALYKIHFPTMTVQDFANRVTTIKGFLTDTEMAQVFQIITVFDNQELECPFPRNFRGLCNYFGPIKEADKMGSENLVFNYTKKEFCDFASAIEHLAFAENGQNVEMASFRLLCQCWMDLLNSLQMPMDAIQANKDIRKELYREFSILKNLAKSRDSQKTMMTKYMEFRSKLGDRHDYNVIDILI